MTYPALVRGSLERVGLSELFEEVRPDQDGALSLNRKRAIEELLTSVVKQQLDEWPQHPSRAVHQFNPDHRWRIISGLQKAVRHGLVKHAADLAGAALHIKPDHLWRRMAIIAMEDVGFANLFAVVVAVTAVANKNWRTQLGEQKLATWLAALMAGSAKDRLACELLTLVDFDRELEPKAAELASLPDLLLARNAINTTLCKAERVLALWLLAGTQRYPSKTLPRRTTSSPSALVNLMLSNRLPLALAYCLHPLTRHTDGLFIPLPLIDEMLRGSASCDERRQPVPATVQFQGVTSAAFDMHTREGLAALRRFRHECEPLRRLIGSTGLRSPDRFVGHAVFQAEGGVLDRRLVYADSEKVYARANLVELGYFGLPHDLHRECLRLIRAHLGKLNDIRRQVLDGG